MEIDTELTDNGTLVVVLNGRMSLTDLQDLEETLKSFVRPKHKIIFDLSGLEFIFSMGLRSLIICAQTAQLRGGKLVLVSSRPTISNVLKAGGISKLIPLYNNLDAAEAGLAS
jgi:anti-sigma B factor antagonist